MSETKRRLKPAATGGRPIEPQLPDMAATEARGWGVEKRLRIEFIVGTAILLAGYVWYGGKIDAKIQNQDERLSRLERIADIGATAANKMDVRLTRMETTAQHMTETLTKIDRTLAELNRKAR